MMTACQTIGLGPQPRVRADYPDRLDQTCVRTIFSLCYVCFRLPFVSLQRGRTLAGKNAGNAVYRSTLATTEIDNRSILGPLRQPFFRLTAP